MYLCKKHLTMDIKPFKQIPEWNADERFEISAEELYAITKLGEAQSYFIPIFEQMMKRFIDAGQVAVHYEDMEGNEISKEDVKDMMSQVLMKIQTDDNPGIEPTI
jgi:hypothetical protein